LTGVLGERLAVEKALGQIYNRTFFFERVNTCSAISTIVRHLGVKAILRLIWGVVPQDIPFIVECKSIFY
jgi:hypothetical protein